MNALAAVAEDPERFTEPPDGSERVVTERSCPVIGPERRWAGVCALRLPDDQDAVDPVCAAMMLGFVEVATLHTLQS